MALIKAGLCDDLIMQLVGSLLYERGSFSSDIKWESINIKFVKYSVIQ